MILKIHFFTNQENSINAVILFFKICLLFRGYPFSFFKYFLHIVKMLVPVSIHKFISQKTTNLPITKNLMLCRDFSPNVKAH